jgi:hypothetical protein
LLLQLFKPDDVLWIGATTDSCNDDADESRKVECRKHFRAVAEWLTLPAAPGQFTCPSVFKSDVNSRSNVNILHRRYLVVESDSLTKPEIGAVFSWCQQFMRLRAVVDTAGRSLHGWFETPGTASEAVHGGGFTPPSLNSEVKDSGFKAPSADTFLDSKSEIGEIRTKAGKGQAAAQDSLGGCYFGGDGVVKDYVEAAKWFRRAAEQGYGISQYNLGVCYDNGFGVQKDFVQAYKWYNLAAAQSTKAAITNLASLERQMTPIQIADAQRLSREFKVTPESASENAAPVK